MSQVDDKVRPLALCQCGGDLPPGVAGYYQNIPVRLDANIPTTFGGAGLAPQMGYITNGQYAALAGTGSGSSYTPMLLARPDDLFMFPGEVRLQTLDEVLSGSMQVRFQASQYLVAMPNRFVAAAAVGSSVSAGGDVAHATLTSQHSGLAAHPVGEWLLMAVRKPAAEPGRARRPQRAPRRDRGRERRARAARSATSPSSCPAGTIRHRPHPAAPGRRVHRRLRAIIAAAERTS